MSEELWRLSATELHRRYRERSLTPLEVAQDCLARLEAVNPRINAVIARRDREFLAEAQASTQRHTDSRPLSAIDGIPLTVKDSLYTADLPTSWGCRALRTHATGQDELSVGRARAAGGGRRVVRHVAGVGRDGRPRPGDHAGRDAPGPPQP